jgi:hypothetical protein
MEATKMRVFLVNVFAALLGLLFLVPTPSEAQSDKEAAKKHFKQGTILYKEGNYSAALVEFKASYKKNPNWKIRFHIGITYQALHKFMEAEEQLKLYLGEGGAQVAEDKKTEVEDILSQLEGVIGSLKIVSSVDGASVLLDGEALGETPIPKPVRLNVGEYKVVVKKEGYKDFTGEVEIPGGETVSLEVKLESLAPPKEVKPAPAEKPPEKAIETAPAEKPKENKKAEKAIAPEKGEQMEKGKEGKGKSKKKSLMIGGGAALGVGGALLIAGAALGGTALSVGNDLEDRCPGGDCGPTEHDDYDRMKTMALGSDLLPSLGGAVAVTGIVLLAVGGLKERKTGTGSVKASFMAPAGAVLEWRY